MYAGLADAIMIAAVLVGAWCFVAAGRDRWLGRSHLAALAVVELAVLVQTVLAIVRIAGGERPGQFVTFVGYLIVATLTVPGTVAVSFMERTRWGSVIAGAGALILAVLVLRLGQVWTHG